MNEAIQSFRWHRAQGDALDALEDRTNRTPYKAIGYAFPVELLERILVRTPF